jgi:hypothetical protein
MKLKSLIAAFMLIALIVAIITFSDKPKISCFPENYNSNCEVGRLFSIALNDLINDVIMLHERDDSYEATWESACEKYFNSFASSSNSYYEKIAKRNSDILLEEPEYVCEDGENILVYYKYRIGNHGLGFCYDGSRDMESLGFESKTSCGN